MERGIGVARHGVVRVDLARVLRYRFPPIINGVASNMPGVVPYSGRGTSLVFHSQASFNVLTFARLIWSSDEYLVLA